MIDYDPDYWKFSNEDGKLERCDMRQFERDLDAAIAYSKQSDDEKEAPAENQPPCWN